MPSSRFHIIANRAPPWDSHRTPISTQCTASSRPRMPQTQRISARNDINLVLAGINRFNTPWLLIMLRCVVQKPAVKAPPLARNTVIFPARKCTTAPSVNRNYIHVEIVVRSATNSPNGPFPCRSYCPRTAVSTASRATTNKMKARRRTLETFVLRNSTHCRSGTFGSRKSPFCPHTSVLPRECAPRAIVRLRCTLTSDANTALFRYGSWRH